ncbi:MAG: ABC transporter substrate-binding protein [Butyrivibrio sp.]|nr:ABC transporter substrate-binding protein [Butyrivibrio sp.]
MKKKLFTSLVLTAALSIGALTGCGSASTATATDSAGNNENASAKSEASDTASAETSDNTPAETETSNEDKVIRVGATPVPHAEILDNIVKEILAEDGWTLETVIFQDYVLPNTSLEAEELDANYFQTLAYMNGQNEESGLHLTAVTGVHIEPMGIYSQKYTSIEDIPDGAEIGVPNGPDNEDRALDLLVQKGLLVSTGNIKTDDNYTEKSLTEDKEANPHGYVITALDPASLPLSLPDLDAAVINGNYALEANLPSTYPALEIEEFDDETSIKRTNFLVVKEGNEASEKTTALINALKSDKVKEYIEETYKGAVIPSFIDPQ